MNPAFEVTATFASPLEVPAAEPSSGWVRWAMCFLRPARSVAPEGADRSTGLYNRAGLFGAANDVIGTQVNASPASMILLEFADLREVYDIYGSAIGRKLVDRIVKRLRGVAGARGLVGRTGPAQFCIVLPGVTQSKALQRLHRSFGQPARVELDAGDNEIVLVPTVLVDSVEPGAHDSRGVQGLYREMCRELSRIEEDEQRRLTYLASERERHSRPMGVMPLR